MVVSQPNLRTPSSLHTISMKMTEPRLTDTILYFFPPTYDTNTRVWVVFFSINSIQLTQLKDSQIVDNQVKERN